MDLVHDIQSVYRKVLNSMARPGKIEVLEEQEKVDMEINFNRGTFLIMLMLLDGEVSFNVVSEKSEEVSNLISEITYSKEKPLEEADYVFVLEDAVEEKLAEVYSLAKVGTLINPNKSATIISEVEFINDDGKLELSGPGIKDKKCISIGESNAWIKERNLKNKEYPLGVDGIFIDKEYRVVSLPRTTKINRKED